MTTTLPLFINYRKFRCARTGLMIFLSVWQLMLFAQVQEEKGDLLLVTGELKHGMITCFSDQPQPNLFLVDAMGARNNYYLKEVNHIILLSGEKYVTKKYKSGNDSSVLLFKALIESPQISLYEKPDDGMTYFYVLKHDLLYRLENNKLTETKDQSMHTTQDYKYLRILGALMADRMDLVSNLHKVNLEENDLRTIISEYNKGIATYYWTAKSNQKRDPNWMVFMQYSNDRTYLGEQTPGNSFGLNAGVQYYFSKKSRSSFKFSVEYATYHFADGNDEKVISLGSRWQYDIVRSEIYNFYFQMHLMDVSATSTTSSEGDIVSTEHHVFPIPRLSPAMGLEIKPFRSVLFLLEVNNLFQLDYIGRNYSIGMKYDIGDKYW
jgi:hypothetical protein